MNKKGMAFNAGTVIAAIIGIVLVFTILANTIGEVTTAGNAVNDTGVPLAGLFASDGVFVLALMAAVLLGGLAALGIVRYKAGRR